MSPYTCVPFALSSSADYAPAVTRRINDGSFKSLDILRPCLSNFKVLHVHNLSRRYNPGTKPPQAAVGQLPLGTVGQASTQLYGMPVRWTGGCKAPGVQIGDRGAPRSSSIVLCFTIVQM